MDGPAAPIDKTQSRLLTAWIGLGFRLSVSLAALVFPLALLLARLDWRVDLLTNFRGPGVVACLVAAIAWVRHARVPSAAFGLFAVFLAWPLTEFCGRVPVPPDPHPAGRFKIVMANVYEVSHHYEELADLIRQEQPDAVVLVEFTAEWQAGLEATGVVRGFPHRLERPNWSRGLALWLRSAPIRWGDVETLSPLGNPVVHAEIEFAGRPLRLWGVHPPNPLNYREWSAQDLNALGRRIGAAGGTQVVVGDLNRADDSPHFADFVRLSGLRDSRAGFGRQPSWPTWSPYRIAIDHGFVSSDLAVVDRRLGPSIGSDHLPLILELAPAASTASSSMRLDQAETSSVP